MPNHIKHLVEVSGKPQQIKELFTLFQEQSPKHDFDFNCIIPEPKDDPNYKAGENIPLAEADGYNWYNWRLEHWDTKWNAYQLDDNPSNPVTMLKPAENTIEFYTAWSTPAPIFTKLSTMFPDLTLTVHFASEDTGYDCGTTSYQNGVAIDHTHFVPGSPEAEEFADTLWGWGTEDETEYIETPIKKGEQL